MSQSLVENYIHVVFSTKHRHPWLTPDSRPKLFAYLSGIFQNLERPVIELNGVNDHIHILFLH